jgi:hypothetical protein
MGFLIKIAGSLLAIYALYLLARKLGLGGDTRIRDAAHADAIVRESLIPFAAADIIVDRAGMAALLRDATGQMVLVRKHGAHFVASPVPPDAEARLDKHFLTLRLPPPAAAQVTLNLGEKAQYWAAAMRHMHHG